MDFHYLQHVPFEGPGSIAPWMHDGGHRLTGVPLYSGAALPAVAAIDGLVVMGGPMSVHDEAAYPWLTQEKRFIEAVIAAGRPVLGVCLGGQLIAEVLGGAVIPGQHKEIGWFEIRRRDEAARSALAGFLPERLDVFHWHGETFTVPEDAIPLASSEACTNQGFVYDERVVALQFHLETTEASARALIENAAADLAPGPYVQAADAMLADPARFTAVNGVMAGLLERLTA